MRLAGNRLLGMPDDHDPFRPISHEKHHTDPSITQACFLTAVVTKSLLAGNRCFGSFESTTIAG